jgi:hypothetical protein
MPSLIKQLKWFFVDQFMFHISGGGGGGGSPAPVTQNVSNTNIPAYAQPYVENMLGQAAALTDINQNPYQTYGGARIADFSPLQQQAFSNVANQTTASQLVPATGYATAAGAGSLQSADTAGMYGQMGSGYGNQAASLAPQAQQYGQIASDIGMGGLGYGAMGAMAGMQAGQAGNQYARMATDPGQMQSYMNPYVQASLQPQLNLLNQQAGLQGAAQQGAATSAGAFGGSRSALANSLSRQNSLMAQQQAIGQGYNQAYQQAQQAQQFGANLGLQGKQAQMQGAQVGLSGLNTAMQGQQTGLQGLQQAGNLYGQGMTGAQIGLQGVGAQQAGYAGANQAAGTLGQLGQTQFGQQQAINQAQQTTGAVQQAQAQQALDQSYQDFLKQKNYPYQQLAFMGDMTRGLPLSQTANTMYSAPPNAASQLGGLGMSALGIYGMSGGFKQANGGVVHAANGGLMAAKAYKEGGYAGGGQPMSGEAIIKQLTQMLDNPELTPQEVEAIEKKIILYKRMLGNPESDQIMAPAEQQMAQNAGIGAIPTGDMVPEQMAGGGIVAFAAGGQNKENYQSFLENQVRKSIEDQLGEDSFAKSDAEKAKLEQAIADRRERSPYEALAMAGLGTMAGTSPNFFANLGLGGTEGLKSYSKSAAAEAADRKTLLEQQVYADKAEQARKAALTGQMQTTLGSMYAKQAAQAAAGAGSEEKALLRVQALINQDDQLPLLYKQRDMYDPGTPKYQAYNDAINSIKKTYFEQAGIKRPYVAPAGVQLPPEPEKTSLIDDFKNLFSSKPAASQNKVVPFSQLPTKG